MKLFISALAFLVTTYAFGNEADTPCPAMNEETREKVVDVNAVKKPSSSSQTAVAQ